MECRKCASSPGPGSGIILPEAFLMVPGVFRIPPMARPLPMTVHGNAWDPKTGVARRRKTRAATGIEGGAPIVRAAPEKPGSLRGELRQDTSPSLPERTRAERSPPFSLYHVITNGRIPARLTLNPADHPPGDPRQRHFRPTKGPVRQQHPPNSCRFPLRFRQKLSERGQFPSQYSSRNLIV